MNLEHYSISAICNYDDAAVYAITKMKVQHFTEQNRKLFKIATGLYKLNKRVDLGVFESQAQGLGYSKADAQFIYHYALDFDDNWLNNFEELKKVGTYRIISENTHEIDQLRLAGESIQKISGKATKFASEWITGLEKTYYSGKEVDELTEEIGSPIKTGYPIFDDEIYKYGGNRTGQMLGVLLREKHGKTRSQCWECAQNIRMGHKVLYFALEATKKEIVGNVKQVLQHEWEEFRENFFVVDGVRELSEMEAITMEAVLVDGVQKVVIDYAQLIQSSGDNENNRINNAVETFRYLMIKLDFNCVMLTQAKKADASKSAPKDSDGMLLAPKGYKFVPEPDDMYGSNAIIKAASLMIIGFRPNRYMDLVKHSPMGKSVINPHDREASYNSLFMKIGLTRYKAEFLHRWYGFLDTDEGLKLQGWI